MEESATFSGWSQGGGTYFKFCARNDFHFAELLGKGISMVANQIEHSSETGDQNTRSPQGLNLWYVANHAVYDVTGQGFPERAPEHRLPYSCCALPFGMLFHLFCC
jgi:hypothetical protein